MSKSAKERVMDFIAKNLKKEKDKWGAGFKSNYREWEEVLEEMNSIQARIRELEDLKKELRLMNDYLKSTGQFMDFRKWGNMR